MKDVEQNLVAALLEAADYRNGEERDVSIKRGDKILFTFKIGALSEDAWNKARRENTLHRGRRSEEFNPSRYLAQVIFEATLDKSIWLNREVQEKLNVLSGVDVVNAVLKPAEKIRLAEIIEEISGYDETNLDDLIKN